MNSLFRWSIKNILRLGIVSLLLVAPWLAAQDIRPAPNEGSTYLVTPDYRKCAFPACGGWFLTPVNQLSLQLEDEQTAYENSLLPAARSIYVSHIDYRRLRLTKEQIRELEERIHGEHVLLRGVLSDNVIGPQNPPQIRTLRANGAWVSANKTEPFGPFLRISSTGIVCITTPCPYYKAELINTAFSTIFHDFNFEKAELDREQTGRAWQAIASEGLVITGVTYDYEGMTGPGTGIAATKVFFSYPEKK